MTEMDGRKPGHEALEAIRIRAVKRVELGESPEVVIEALGFHRSVIYRWIAPNREGGIEALNGRKAGGPAPKAHNAERCSKFLKRLTYRATTPTFFVLDGHQVHKCKRVKRFVASTNARLRLFILPPYSPHLHPDEWVWNWLKGHAVGKAPLAGPDQFRTSIDRYLRSLQKVTALVRGFFGDPSLAYITQV